MLEGFVKVGAVAQLADHWNGILMEKHITYEYHVKSYILKLRHKKYQTRFTSGTHVGFWVGGVSNVQLGQRQECDLSRQVHFVELHEYFSAHFISLHNVVKQPEKQIMVINKQNVDGENVQHLFPSKQGSSFLTF